MKQIEGIILKTVDYQENSKILYLITKDGLVSGIIRGAKKLSSHTFKFSQPLTKIDFQLKNDRLITNCQTITNYNNIKDNYDKMVSSIKISEIAYVLGNHINDYSVFYEFISKIFKMINESIVDYRLIEIVFKIKTLYLLGIAPTFNKCLSCGKENDLVFSFNDGGVKCRSCLNGDEFIYNSDVIGLVKKIYYIKLDCLSMILKAISNSDYPKINKFLELYYDHYLGFKSNVDKVLK